MSSKCIKVVAIFYGILATVVSLMMSAEDTTYGVISSMLAGLFWGLGCLAAFSYAEYKADCNSEIEESEESKEEEESNIKAMLLRNFVGSMIGFGIVAIMPWKVKALLVVSVISFLVSFGCFYFIDTRLLQRYS